MSDLPEAGAVAFFSYKRTDGYEVSLTLRDQSGREVLTRIDAAIEILKQTGATPLAKNQSFSKPPTKRPEPIISADGLRLCSKHGVAMTPKEGKYGTFYSHKTPDGEWCNDK